MGRMALSMLVVVALLNTPGALGQDRTSPISGLQINRPGALKKQYPNGMLHSMALFGVPHYGKKLGAIRIYDATNNTESDGCSGWKADPEWSRYGPFAVLINRGKCHFTTKVAYAHTQGASAVIVRDTSLLRGQPASYCPNYEKPVLSGDEDWCFLGVDASQCRCPASGNVKPKMLPSVPKCPDATGNEVNTAVYEKVNCQSEAAPCWKCSVTGDVFPLSPDSSGTRVIEYHVPFMADDGTGGSISIPSFIVSDYDGENLRNAIHNSKVVTITMAWDMPQRSDVSYEMWTSSEDHNGAEFKRDFQELAVQLRDSTTFKPRYFIYDGKYQDCFNKVNCGSLDCTICKDLCILNGRYCGPDPDGTFDKIRGADIVHENLRQICIFKVLSKSTSIAQRKKDQGKWWCYANEFANNCYGEDGPMSEPAKFHQCAEEQMRSVGIDVAAVNKCINDAGGVECTSATNCQKNSLLESELNDRKEFGILSLPSIVVNGVLLRTAKSAGGAAEQTVLEAICNAFAAGFAPDICMGVSNPMCTKGSGGTGTGSVTFDATLKYDGKYSYTEEISDRLASTLAMKLGIEYNCIHLKQKTNAGESSTLSVSLTGLKCGRGTDKEDETKNVAQLLSKVNSCEDAVTSADNADKEVKDLENKAFYFHTHIPSDKKTHKVTATMTNVENTCDSQKEESKGVSWLALIIVIVSLIALGTGAGFVWYRRVRNDMRERVQNILEQYQPLEEISGKDESETAAML